jgi:hypothetical protein
MEKPILLYLVPQSELGKGALLLLWFLRSLPAAAYSVRG